MAKMHSRKKGKSASKKPSKMTKKSWNTYSSKEVEQLVAKMGKTGMSSSLIGMELRDSYGIPDVKTITNKKISTILAESKLAKKFPEDLVALIKRDVQLMKHVELYKKDISAKRGLQLTKSKINRLTKYYVSEGKLPKGWAYDRGKAKLLLE